MKEKIIFAFIIAIITSILPNIIIREFLGSVPPWLTFAKLVILLSVSISSIFIRKIKELSKFALFLTLFIAAQILSGLLSATSLWRHAFDTSTFIGSIGSNILLKFTEIIPITLMLLIMLKSVERFYLCKGDLSIKSDKIPWLGVRGGSISWKRLSIISALLISLGTALLSIVTVPNLSDFNGLDRLMNNSPAIVLFALANSFCEGILYRSAVMGTLREELPKKYTVLIAAVFFGIPHYYGVPNGILGAIMSTLLGWYMCRSMYETKGFASSWIIHFMQDAVIFSLLCLTWNYV